MVSKLSPNLTERITGYSDGVLPIDSMMQWNPTTPKIPQTAGTDLLDSPLTFTINVRHKTSVDSMSDSQKKRIFISYLILARVPDKGLDELLKTVGEILEFYTFREEISVPKMIAAPQVKVNLKDPSIRPEFPILGDEV